MTESYRVTPASVGITPRNDNPFTTDLNSGENNSTISEDYEKVFKDESIQGGITAKKGEGTSGVEANISKELQLLETDKLNVSGNIRGGAFSNNTTRDGTIYDENGKRVGASIGGTLILNASGSNWLTGSIGKDYSKVNLKEVTKNSEFKDDKGETFTEWGVGINLGPLNVDLPKGQVNYKLNKNGTIQIFADPKGVGISGGFKFNKGGTPMMNRQMEMFEDGGLKDEGGMIDKESGNDVPVGSTRKEVRDDIPAQLSEGEFVFPADVVRYIGLEKLMGIRQKAKMGLQRMEDMGQMGNSDEATMPDDMPFDETDLIIIDGDKEVEMAKGGVLMAAEGTDVKKRYTFDQLMGQNKLSFRIYKNKDGVGTTIRFAGDSPVDPIPEGFYPIDEAGIPVIPETDTGDTDTVETDTDTEKRTDYGDGAYDDEGNWLGAGNDKDLSDARDQFIDRTLTGTLTKVDKFFMTSPQYKALSAADKFAFEKIRGVTDTTPYTRAVTRLRSEVISMDEDNPEYEYKRSLLDKADADQDKKQREINAKDPSIGGPDGDVTFGGVTSGVGTGGTGGGIGLADEESQGNYDFDSDDTDYGTGTVDYGNDYSSEAEAEAEAASYGFALNKGGLAGKKPKSKKKQYKKGGLATSKKQLNMTSYSSPYQHRLRWPQ